MFARVLIAASLLHVSLPALADGVGTNAIKAADTTFPAIVSGEGTPVIFVHGLLGDHRVWTGLADATVEDGHRFVAYTQRGFGPASSASDPFSRDRHVEDLVAILKEIDVPASIVAWSYGGAVALGAAIAAPDRVRRIVLYEPYLPDLSSDADASIGASMSRTVEAMDAGDIDAAAETAIEALLGLGDGGFTSQPPEVQAFQRDNAPSFAASWNADTPTAISCEELGTIHAPLLILTGSKTLPGFVELSNAVAACVPGATSVTMDGQGHGGPALAPDAFGKLALNFIDGA